QPATGYTNLVPDSLMQDVTLSQSWLLAGGMANAAFATNEMSMQYTGTGAASGSGVTATSNLFYLPAGTYAFSGYIDASNTTAGTPEMIVQNAGGTAQVTLAQAAGAKGTLSGTFTLGAATICKVVCTTNNSTVQSGLLQTFAEPQIVTGSVAPAYSAGPGYTAPGQIQNQSRCVTVVPLSATGTALLPSQQALVQSYLNSLREVNFQVNVIAPNYVGIDVNYNVVCDSTFNPASVEAAINAALTSYFSPLTWAEQGNISGSS